jgi:anti-sigma regulatory factor (Ser/Thr protein kinase)
MTSVDAVTVDDVAWFRVEHTSVVGTIRRAAVDLAQKLGLEDVRASEIGIAATEVAGNQLKHAGGGTFLLRACRGLRGGGVGFVAADRGPGIPDVDAAMQDGHSTTGTLGIGLGAIARLATTCDVYSVPGAGTVVAATFGVCDLRTEVAAAAGLTRPMPGQDVCGDTYAIRVDGPAVTVVLADGLGHGALAATASRAAVRGVIDAEFGPPAALLAAAHEAAQGTRGAAVAVAQVTGDGEIRYAGTGNIAGHLLDDDKRRGMISHPGIVGVNARSPRENAYHLEPDTVVVLHTDGVTDRLTLDVNAGLLRRSSLVISSVVLRDNGTRNDDAGVVVIRPHAAA